MRMTSEEFIDTSQQAGGRREKVLAWSTWAEKPHRFKALRVARETGLLDKKGGWRNVVEHMLVVNAAAVWLARGLEAAGQVVAVQNVDDGSLLHDVDKKILKDHKISRNEERFETTRDELLRRHGYSEEVIAIAKYTARVEEIFIETEAQQDAAIAAMPLEKLLMAYADARVRNTEIVSLEEARDKNKEKIPAEAAFYDQWYRFYKKVEERIFDLLGVKSEMLNNASVFTMVKAAR